TTASRQRGNSPMRCALRARSGRQPRAARRCPRRPIRTRRCSMSRPRPSRRSPSTAIAIVAALAVVGAGVLAAAWWRNAHDPGSVSAAAAQPSASQLARTAKAPAAVPGAAAQISQEGTGGPAANGETSASPAASAASVPSGSLLISAVGMVDPSDPRYANDKTLLQADVRADSKSQLVEKALVLLLDRNSFTSHYDLLQSRLMANSGPFIDTIVRETEPQIGKNGLMSVTTQAVVNVKAVQQSLN